MRHFAIASLFLISMLSTSFAGQLGGLSTNMGQGGLSLSTSLSYIDVDIENGSEDEATSRQFVFKGSYGLHPNVDVIVKIGFADLEVDSFEGRLDTLYGVGVKAKVFQDPEDKTNILVGGELTAFNSKANGPDADVLDYGLSVVVTKKAGNITPYGGIKLSETEIDVGRKKYTAEKNVGILTGVDYFVNPNVFFNGEISIFDQEALHLGVGYKF